MSVHRAIRATEGCVWKYNIIIINLDDRNEARVFAHWALWSIWTVLDPGMPMLLVCTRVQQANNVTVSGWVLNWFKIVECYMPKWVLFGLLAGVILFRFWLGWECRPCYLLWVSKNNGRMISHPLKPSVKLGESRCIALVVVVSPCLQAPQHP